MQICMKHFPSGIIYIKKNVKNCKKMKVYAVIFSSKSDFQLYKLAVTHILHQNEGIFFFQMCSGNGAACQDQLH